MTLSKHLKSVLLTAFVLQSVSVSAQDTVNTVMDLPEVMEGYEMRIVEVALAPGQASAPIAIMRSYMSMSWKAKWKCKSGAES